MSKRIRSPHLSAWLLAGVLAFAVLLAACGSGDDSKGTPTPSPATSLSASPVAGLQPLEVVRATLDAINQADLDLAYSYLSQDARKAVSLDDARRVITGLKLAGVTLAVTIDKAGDPVISGDFAEVPLTLTVQLSDAKVPVEDESSLLRENGEWRISDHFVQTALAAVHLATPLGKGPRELDDKGCAAGDPMEGVYAPARLKILDPCLTVSGVVRDDIEHAEDGDITFGLYLSDADKARLINEVNVANYDSALHIEIVPEDQARVKTPKPGDHITVTGPWVTDLVHGHNEIHPAYKIVPAAQ